MPDESHKYLLEVPQEGDDRRVIYRGVLDTEWALKYTHKVPTDPGELCWRPAGEEGWREPGTFLEWKNQHSVHHVNDAEEQHKYLTELGKLQE